MVASAPPAAPLCQSPEAILAAIDALPVNWPLAGSLRRDVLRALACHAAARPLGHSVETGTGKSTLLLSHLSAHHVVFTDDDAGRGDSLALVRAAPLLRTGVVEFVVGPTQRTLPGHRFASPLDLVLIDGPHGFPFPHLEYYFVYPHLAPGALLVLDDIHIRTVNDLFRFLRADAMFELQEVVHTTAFLRRTTVATFDPVGDGWWRQRYNLRRWPPPRGLSAWRTLVGLLPLGVQDLVRRLTGAPIPIRPPEP
jgi:predicted O-methyltransferase YrrM